jgi:hypothetical protein
MTPDQVFSIVNLIALVSWILLAALPRRRWVLDGVLIVVVALFAATYIAVIAVNWLGSSGGFSSLAQVAALFSNRWLLLAGWIHYLAFDLLVGRWETIDARSRGIPHLAVVPCLFLTFMFGPAGWLAYFAIRSFAGRAIPATPAAAV